MKMLSANKMYAAREQCSVLFPLKTLCSIWTLLFSPEQKETRFGSVLKCTNQQCLPTSEAIHIKFLEALLWDYGNWGLIHHIVVGDSAQTFDIWRNTSIMQRIYAQTFFITLLEIILQWLCIFTTHNSASLFDILFPNIIHV